MFFRMINKHIYILLACGFLFIQNNLVSQEFFTINGTITDTITGDPLPGANIFVEPSKKGAISDKNGYYSLVLNSDNYLIHYSFLGYGTKQISVNLNSNKILNISLTPVAIKTNEVIITADSPSGNVENLKTGTIKLSGKELLKMPALMGETDPLMAIHYTPGVQSMSEGNSGFHVRGGNVDQNLILLDNATVFNPSHVLGFFSVFNTDIISDVDLIKSGMPVKYGGRISSVLIINTKDGNYEKPGFGANIGLISCKITAEGPIIKDRLSFITSFRRTYIDEVLKPVFRPFTSGNSSFYNSSRYHFYDFNGKFSWILNQRHRINFLFYSGDDFFKLEEQELNYNNQIRWGNTLYSLTWNYTISSNTNLNSSFSYNDYTFAFEAGQNEVAVSLFSQIKKWNYRTEFVRKNWRLGFDGHFNYFIPNRLLLDINNISLDYSANQKLHSTEMSVYTSYTFEIGNVLGIYGGLRYTNFLHLGPYTSFSESTPGVYTDTLSYDDFSIVKPYNSIEPRVTARLLISRTSSVKASYTKNYQYIHIASASSVTLPSDIWIPSSLNIKPQHADHFSLGYYRNFLDNKIIASLEAYYKNLQNQIELLYGIGIGFQEKSFEKSITVGKGQSKGIELMIEKKEGRTTGWIGYTLSKTDRKFPEINDNKVYPAKYDRRHDINLVMMYELNSRWSFSSAFIYATGNAMSLPYQKYIIDGKVLNYYGNTNSFRMPAYHRLDIAANYKFKVAQRFESFLNFSVFNVYNRANPFYIYFEVSGDVFKHNLKVKARQISLFPVIPSVSWNIKF